MRETTLETGLDVGFLAITSRCRPPVNEMFLLSVGEWVRELFTDTTLDAFLDADADADLDTGFDMTSPISDDAVEKLY